MFKKLRSDILEIACVYPDIYRNAPSRHYYESLRRDYHANVYNWQTKNNCIADKKKRREIYIETARNLTESHKRKGRYVPKKFK